MLLSCLDGFFCSFLPRVGSEGVGGPASSPMTATHGPTLSNIAFGRGSPPPRPYHQVHLCDELLLTLKVQLMSLARKAFHKLGLTIP